LRKHTDTMRKQTAHRLAVPLRHITPIPRQPFVALFPKIACLAEKHQQKQEHTLAEHLSSPPF